MTLVDDPMMAVSDLGDLVFEDLILADETLISTEDILFYDWDNHALLVTKESYQRLIEAVGGSVPGKGEPFVLVAKGGRIFASAF
jgi:hypothetical protein